MTNIITDQQDIAKPDVDKYASAFIEQFGRGIGDELDDQGADDVDAGAGDAQTGDDVTDTADTTDSGVDKSAAGDDTGTNRSSGTEDSTGTNGEIAESAVPALDSDGENAAPPPAATSLSVPLPDGSAFDLDVEAAQQLIALGSWTQSLAPEVVQQFSAIERGQAVAIDKAEYEQFAAYKQLQQSRKSQDGDVWQELEDSGVSPETIAQLRLQAQRAERLEPVPQYEQQAAQQRAQAAIEQYQAGVSDWAAQHGITDQQTLDNLSAIAIRDGVVATFVQQEQQKYLSPTGVPLRDPDLKSVAAKAMTYALATDPQLSREVLSPPQVSADTNAKVNAKKARAASVASAPSTAVPHATGDTPTTLQGRIDGMTQFLESRMNGNA